MAQQVKVPTVGESITEVTIANWLKKDGDVVKMDEVIAELESDKATFELTAPQAGVLKISKAKGDVVPIGTVICEITDGGANTASAPAAKETKTENSFGCSATTTVGFFGEKIGYFISDHYNISIGVDHMKYVMRTGQTANVSGTINLPEDHPGFVYNGTYDNTPVVLEEDFLDFEHTDGLNYENIECRRHDILFSRKNIAFSVSEGIGVGVLVPRTNTTLMNNKRYDAFHLAGYGMGMVFAFNMTYFKHLFIQSEWKGGFIHMPDIRTTMNKEDRASQYFWFSQYNIVFGANFRINCKKKKETNGNL
jgi:pyruvate/2-oxoglutarate dehydrogenase complex dihydrolipoamide acyltransferase (E2) component